MTSLRRVVGRTTRWLIEGESLQLRLDTTAGAEVGVNGREGNQLVLRPVASVVDGQGGTALVSDSEAAAVPLLQAGGLAGIRTHHTWRWPDGTYAGDGFVECWLGSDLRVSVGIRVLDAAVDEAGVLVDGNSIVAEGASLRLRGGPTIEPVIRGATAARALDWVRPRPPFYARWMSFVEQWTLDPGAHGLDLIDDHRPQFRYTAKPASVGLTAAGTLRVCASEGPHAGDDDMPGRQDPTTGAWLVDLAHDEDEVVIPAGPDTPVVLDLMGHSVGATDVEVEGAPAEATLVSRAAGIDDPVVPLRRRHDDPADSLIIRTRRSPLCDVRVRTRSVRGIHAAVQARDDRRRITIHDDRDPRHPVAVIDPVAARLEDLRLPGSAVAIADLPLHWLRYLGKSAAHVADEVTAVDVEEWGPEVVDITLHSRTVDEAATSTTRLRFPRRADRLDIHVDTALKGAAAWRTSTAEFVDVFPEWGIDPSRWRYRTLALLRDGQTTVVDMQDPFPGLERFVGFPAHALEAYGERSRHPEYGPWSLGTGDAVLLHGADAGDVVITLGPVSPESLEQVATYCEHWGDVHLDVVRPGQSPAPTEVSGPQSALPDEIATSYSVSILPPIDGGLDAALARMREETHDSVDGVRR